MTLGNLIQEYSYAFWPNFQNSPRVTNKLTLQHLLCFLERGESSRTHLRLDRSDIKVVACLNDC